MKLVLCVVDCTLCAKTKLGQRQGHWWSCDVDVVVLVW